MQFDLALVNGKLVVPKVGVVEANVGVIGGRIVALTHPSVPLEAAEYLDARGLHVLPGVIDPHHHLGFAGRPMEEFGTETLSAAIGGVTTVVSYILNPEPYDEYFLKIRAVAERLSWTDFAFSLGGFTEDQRLAVPHYYTDFGISSFKYFTSFRGGEASKLGIPQVNDGFMFDFFRTVAAIPGGIVSVHTENIELVWLREREVRASGRVDLGAWNEARPDYAEANACQTALDFGRLTGCPIYIPHLSSRAALEVCRRHRERGGQVIVETCPHYLTLTVDTDIGVVAKINPPVRTQADQDALWEGVVDGSIDTIGSDHSGRKKEVKRGTIWDVGPAFPGTATLLPILLSEGVNRRGLSLTRLAEVVSYNAARAFDLYPRKGTIAIGSDADFTVVDLDLERIVRAEELGSFSDYSPWDGWKLRGWPVQTIVRGRTVVRNGQPVTEQGYAQYLSRNPNIAAAAAQ